MKFSLLVLGSPASGTSSRTAYQFAAAALAGGHTLYRVFFLDEGVINGTSFSVIPQDETHWGKRWQALGRDHHLDLVVCVSSALKRGIVDSTEANRYELPAASLLDGFTISGLGQLIDAHQQSDRVITFGT